VRILIAEPLDFSPEAVRILKETGEVYLRQLTQNELRIALKEYDVCWFRLAHRIDRTMFNGGLRCHLLATPVTGLDHIDLEACAEHGIEVISLRGETDFLKDVRATAELTIALTLALMRHIPEAAASVKHGIWNRDLFRGRELFGKTAGIVGMGRLGKIVAEYFKAFGMTVLGYDPVSEFPERVARRVSSLTELLEESDVVSLHVPYAPATRHLIGREELALMKKESILVNTSRGGVIDEDALLEALRSARLQGAALDVLADERFITGEHPLIQYARRHRNLLVVPHIGGNTSESFEKTEVFLARKVVEALRNGANHK
jgi:D-3-phosphoglycerate dehydrogenase